MKKKIAAVLMLVSGTGYIYAQTKSNPDEARIEYLGGITICADDPKSLADWYTNKFGIPVDHEYRGMYYGTLKFNDVELNMGIHPVSADCQKPPKGFAMTFHVDDYDGYLEKLARKGLVPYKTDPPSGYGRFAYFLDLEKHEVAIWGK
jgi:predicted enzyme related to lactoylglutathione lyase